MKGGDILDFWKGGILEKGGGCDLEKGGMTPLTSYELQTCFESNYLIQNPL